MYKLVKIFTDGSCLGNPGPGGYSIIMNYYQYEKVFSAGYYLTTNNRMELIAAIVALESLKKYCNVSLSTDSQYLQQGVTRWIYKWKEYGWKTFKKKAIKNIDLWQRLDYVLGKHQVSWKWIKGHAGYLKNERCHELAHIAALNPTLKDIGYQSNI